MPFSMMTYLNHILTANPTFHNVKDSSLDPLNNRLQGAGVGPAVNAGLRQQILEALGLIPFAKQQKYTNALNYMRQQFTLGIPAIPYAYPVNLVHRFDSHEVALAAWSNAAMDNRQDGWFEHIFDVTWSSSNGNMQSMANTWNREEVTFLQPAAGPPFRHAVMAQTPQTYAYGGSNNSSGGSCSDNHYFMHPSLMLDYPIAAATVSANHNYQYSPDGQTWYEIPNGQFVFHRGVRNALNGGGLVFYFAKRNRMPLNTRAYRFEVEYPIGAAPANPPANYAAVRGRGTGNSMGLNTYATVIAQQ